MKLAAEELGLARPNRKAQVGIFAFSSKVAPEGMARFQRFGHDIFIVWDAEEPASDLWLVAALEVSRALLVRRAREGAATSTSLAEIDTAIAQLEKDVMGLQQAVTYVGTVTVAAEKLREEVERLMKKVAKRITEMKDGVDALKAAGSGPGA